jgi:hypothetical protein
MSKNTKIAEELGLANLEDLMLDDQEIIEEPNNSLVLYEEDDENISKNILPSEDQEVLESENALVDSVALLEKEMLQHARDLMDLGHNVDIRAAGQIFTIASTMYQNTLNAQISRRDAALKKQKLLIEEAKLLKENKVKNNSPIVNVAVQNNMPENKTVFVGTIDDLLEANNDEAK